MEEGQTWMDGGTKELTNNIDFFSSSVHFQTI